MEYLEITLTLPTVIPSARGGDERGVGVLDMDWDRDLLALQSRCFD